MKAPKAAPASKIAADTTRKKLLAAALDLFGEHGYHGTSIRSIASAAKINIALVSYHFGGKEQLYHELLHSLIAERVQTTLEVLSATANASTPTPAEARDVLKALLGRFATTALSSTTILKAARLIIREQTRPTAAFDAIYKGGMENLHKTVTRLLAIACGRNPETQDSIIRAHMLIGQMFSFVFANAAICRRLGKKTLDKQTLATIATILGQNIDALTRAALI